MRPQLAKLGMGKNMGVVWLRSPVFNCSLNVYTLDGFICGFVCVEFKHTAILMLNKLITRNPCTISLRKFNNIIKRIRNNSMILYDTRWINY